MGQASTSRARLRYIVESAFGTIPVAGNPNELRFAGESLAYSIGTDTSKEIRSDRQTNDLIPTSAQAAGGVNFELSYAEHDDWLESVLQGTWAVYGTAGVGTSFSATYTATTITAAVAPVGANAFTTLAQGQWFKAAAPTGLNAGKWFKVHAVTAPTATVITLDALTPAAIEGPIATTTLSASRLTNGVIERTFVIERAFLDVNQFFTYRGMQHAKLSMGFQSGSVVAGSFDFLGKDMRRDGATQLANPGSAVASYPYDVMNAVSGIGHIHEGGIVLANTFMKKLSIDLDNKLRGRDGIGTLGNVSIGSGTIALKGSMDVYLADGTLYDKFLNNTASSISVRVQDGAGNGYVLTFPRVKYSDAKVNAGSMDQDAMLTMPWEALADPVSGKTIIVDRAGVAV